MNQDIARDYEALGPSQKAWFDKRVAGLDEPVQREWLLYLKVEERLKRERIPVRFNHDMSGFYFTYSVKATDTYHTFYPFQPWEDDEGKGGVTYQCVEDAEEKAHEVFRGVDVETVDGLVDWLKAKIEFQTVVSAASRSSPSQDDPMSSPRQACPDCGVQPGALHQQGCDLEQCPNCGRQSLSCGCTKGQLAVRLPWPGEWPGIAECREFGWYARMLPGVGWLPCEPDEPGAAEDLNRLAVEAEWDPLQMKYVSKPY